MRRLLVATDGSEGADRALTAAAELAKAMDAELVIVNVEQGYLSESVYSAENLEGSNIEAVLYAASDEILKVAQSQAAALGVRKVRTRSGLGDAVGFILDVVANERPDMLVVGKRGRGRLLGLLIGSVSQKLVSLAPCKILVVP